MPEIATKARPPGRLSRDHDIGRRSRSALVVAVIPRLELEIRDRQATENDDLFGDFATIAIAPTTRGSRWHRNLLEIPASRTCRDGDVFVTGIAARSA
ncbi:hypothetical protein TIFTF001_037472 [Ficus carica]|uniref:Uncharacterized protein n=1 Tax=Ficus carica TaxID=3494 RepID=A0AA88E648_FICCA|nr:hypothetical protein TIFTF001_037472 [Ficus carica]